MNFNGCELCELLLLKKRRAIKIREYGREDIVILFATMRKFQILYTSFDCQSCLTVHIIIYYNNMNPLLRLNEWACWVCKLFKLSYSFLFLYISNMYFLLKKCSRIKLILMFFQCVWKYSIFQHNIQINMLHKVSKF